MMARATSRSRRFRSWLYFAAGLVLLAGCTGEDKANQQVGWSEQNPSPTAVLKSPSVNASTPVPVVPTATAVQGALSPDDLVRLRPNELGRIPVLMYHALVFDEQSLDQWSITPAQFSAQLQWLYDNDFYVIPMMDLINNTISAPPGKHPVVLTFDDSSSRQFRLIKDDSGALVPDPDTMLGIMETFFAAHPDFGHTAVFAVVTAKCFAYEGEESTCEERLTWLAEHGYEIANHTRTHENLHTVTDERFMQEVGGGELWINERVTGEANLGRVLVLPFGEWPRSETQVDWMKDRFMYEGQEIRVLAIVEVSGGPAPSPSSGDWDRRSIARVNTEPDVWNRMTEAYSSGQMTFFTSDGNPATVTIPDPIPEDIAGEFDPEWAQAYDMKLIRYDAPVSSVDDDRVVARRDGE